MWERDFGSPLVAMYVLESDGLHRLPFTIIGKHTLDTLLVESSKKDYPANYEQDQSSHNNNTPPWIRQFLFNQEQEKKTL